MADTVSPSFHPGARVYPDGNAIILSGRQSGDSFDRFQLRSDGNLYRGDGTTALVTTDIFGPSELLTTGEVVPSRLSTTNAVTAPATQELFLTYWTCQRTEPVGTIAFSVGGTAASGQTLIRYGLWTADAAGALTALVASTANDATLLGSPNARSPKALQASYTKLRGQRYAVGVLIVGSGTFPVMCGVNAAGGGALGASINAVSPRIAAKVTGQSDLPSTVAAGSLTDLGRIFAAEVY